MKFSPKCRSKKWGMIYTILGSFAHFWIGKGPIFGPKSGLGNSLFYPRFRGKDKSDRATAEQVMDPRTRMILFKMLSRGVITEINGCISTGKEANVYHATGKDGSDRAVKVSSQCC